MNFIPGKKYYMYTKVLSLYTVECIEDNKFKNEQGNIITLNPGQLKFFKDSEDEAYLEYYLGEQNIINEEIDNLKQKLTKLQTKKENLDKKFSYLKDIFPEEFI